MRIVGAIARIRAAAKDVPLVPYLGLSLMIPALQDSGLANALVLCVELVARLCGCSFLFSVRCGCGLTVLVSSINKKVQQAGVNRWDEETIIIPSHCFTFYTSSRAYWWQLW